MLIRALRRLISAELQTQRSITLHGQILYEHHQNNNYQETSRYPLERVRTTLGGDIAGIILDPLHIGAAFCAAGQRGLHRFRLLIFVRRYGQSPRRENSSHEGPRLYGSSVLAA